MAHSKRRRSAEWNSVCCTSRPDDVRSLLLESVPWSPFDFIKGVSREGDRAIHVASLLRDIDPADDMRMSYPLTADTDVAVCAERLPWDSTFFGYDVARLHGVFPLKKDGYCPSADYTPAIDALTALAKSRGIRYLFAVVDSRDLPTSAGADRAWLLAHRDAAVLSSTASQLSNTLDASAVAWRRPRMWNA